MTGPAGASRGVRYSTEQLAAHLEGLVVSGELGEGEKLASERGLAEEFGVSRPVVREALRRLEERNLVEVLPGRGAFVRGTGAADAMKSLGLLLRRRRPTPRDLVEARRMLECEAASLAAARGDVGDLRVMEEALERFERGTDLLEKVGHDLAFHASIIRTSRNPVVEVMFASIAGFVAELMLRSLGDPNVSREGLPYHYEIFEAIGDRDAEGARAAVAGHLLVVERIYGGDFDRPLDILTKERLGYRLDMEEILESLSPQDGLAGPRRADGA